MAIDRAATLRNAEKLLRQGKLDAAIAEYLLVVEDQPRDWNTANILGDLYVRAGQTDKAVDQFVRIADGLSEDGFLPKAIALYKKVLKLKPDHEHALLQAARSPRVRACCVDARTFLNALSERRRARGDERGLAQIRIRLGSLDPADYPARFDAARARILIQDTAGAVREFKALAEELAGQGAAGRSDRRAARSSRSSVRRTTRFVSGCWPCTWRRATTRSARECASTVEQFKAIAAQLDELARATRPLRPSRGRAARPVRRCS